MFGSKRDAVIELWRKLHNEELHNLCFSPNIIRLTKKVRMCWAGQVGKEDKECIHILVGNLKELYRLEYFGAGGRRIRCGC
jgi:hypothetical protein